MLRVLCCVGLSMCCVMSLQCAHVLCAAAQATAGAWLVAMAYMQVAGAAVAVDEMAAGVGGSLGQNTVWCGWCGVGQ